MSRTTPGAFDDPCIDDTKQCETVVLANRDPNNNCEFLACADDDVVCTSDAILCQMGYVGRDPNNNCEFFDYGMTLYAHKMSSYSKRLCKENDPNNNCALHLMQQVTVIVGQRCIKDGTFVSRNPAIVMSFCLVQNPFVNPPQPPADDCPTDGL